MSSNYPEFINDFVNNFSIDISKSNCTSRQHPKFSIYDNCDLVKNIQNKRRLEFLDNLKRKRETIIEKNRLLFEEYLFEDDYSETNTNEELESANSIIIDDDNESQCKMETDSNVTKSNKNKRTLQRIKKRKIKHVADKFMLSEWLVDIPEDFYQNWYMICCPKGKRTLVIASNGRTSVYTRNGYFMFYFESQIPGGSRFPLKHNIKTKNSILDCIFVESEQTFYILDVIIWNGCSFYGCDTEFRFYWMHNNISEEVKKNSTRMAKNYLHINRDNVEMADEKQLFNGSYYRFNFKSLPYWPCTLDNIKLYSNGPYSFNTEIDGILFYHKKVPYTAGITPLVCWLKVPMIPKIFNINLHPNNSDEMEN